MWAGIGIVGVLTTLASCQDHPVDPAIRVREGFRLSVAVAEIKQARFMAFGPDGTLLISDDEGGRIYRLGYAGKPTL